METINISLVHTSTMNYPKKTRFQSVPMLQSRHCAYIIYSVKTIKELHKKEQQTYPTVNQRSKKGYVSLSVFKYCVIQLISYKRYLEYTLVQWRLSIYP